MKNMTFTEGFLIGVIVLIMAIALIGLFKNAGEFHRVCDQAKGTTVWDGCQYQCIKS